MAPRSASSGIAAASVAFVCACVPRAVSDPDAAVAVLQPTQGSQASGVVRFEDDGDDGLPLRVTAEVSGLEPGPHAYHVHLYGDCTASDATSAGTHYDFVGPSLDPPEDVERIAGNLGELRPDRDGTARHSAEVPKATLQGGGSIIGRAVVVHAKGNDPDSPPLGAAGRRVACGVIGIADSADGDAGSTPQMETPADSADGDAGSTPQMETPADSADGDAG